jgi:hypothetical protein
MKNIVILTTLACALWLMQHSRERATPEERRLFRNAIILAVLSLVNLLLLNAY